MDAAETELKASGEYYDYAIFFGTKKFVTDIEAELRAENNSFAAKLGGLRRGGLTPALRRLIVRE